jgi:hypothetical protein
MADSITRMQSEQLILFRVLPVVLAFVVALWFTRGWVRIVVLCLACLVAGAAAGWIAEAEMFRAFSERAAECFHQQYLHLLKP